MFDHDFLYYRLFFKQTDKGSPNSYLNLAPNKWVLPCFSRLKGIYGYASNNEEAVSSRADRSSFEFCEKSTLNYAEEYRYIEFLTEKHLIAHQVDLIKSKRNSQGSLPKSIFRLKDHGIDLSSLH
jgi:hypothetical protein